jgi:FAD/FMN-containing dehydrogenase
MTANDTENSGLFWAIRGGGSNFGVCTELVLKLHPQSRRVFAGTATFSPELLEKLVSTTSEWWANGPSENEGMVQTITRGADGKVS